MLMHTFYNQNQILSAQLIPVNAIRWRLNDTPYPFSKVFHTKQTLAKRVLVIYPVNTSGTVTYHSLCDDRVLPSNINYDAVMSTTNYPFEGESLEVPIPLIIDSDDISFKATEQKTAAGVLFTNKLEYSLPKVTDTGSGKTDIEKLEQQLSILRSGKAFHLLLQLASCDEARSIVLCPEEGAFSASVDDTVRSTKIAITIKNLTGNQFLK